MSDKQKLMQCLKENKGEIELQLTSLLSGWSEVDCEAIVISTNEQENSVDITINFSVNEDE